MSILRVQNLMSRVSTLLCRGPQLRFREPISSGVRYANTNARLCFHDSSRESRTLRFRAEKAARYLDLEPKTLLAKARKGQISASPRRWDSQALAFQDFTARRLHEEQATLASPSASS